jgi:hypothetical protein
LSNSGHSEQQNHGHDYGHGYAKHGYDHHDGHYDPEELPLSLPLPLLPKQANEVKVCTGKRKAKVCVL